jgi:hypothetical protein
MVILYIDSTCCHMKSVFYERQQPPQVSKSVPSQSLDHIGRIEPKFDVPWSKIEPPSRQPCHAHGALLSPMLAK